MANRNPYLVIIILENLNPDYYRLKKYNKFTKQALLNHYEALLYEYLEKEYGLGQMNEVYAEWIKKYDSEWRNKPEKYASVDKLIDRYPVN